VETFWGSRVRRALLGCAVVGVALAAAATAPASSVLDRIVLRAAQVGPGYVRHVLPGGTLVRGQVTLDLCGQRYGSEALRTARLQVGFVKSGSLVVLSNEVVVYRGSGAQEAVAEVRLVAAHCPTTPQTGPAQGEGPARYTIRILRAPGLTADSLALVQHFDGLFIGRHVIADDVIIYQARKNFLSAVYAYGPSVASQMTLALHAAGEAAANLRRV
jgi:hypothetical protein